MATEAEREFSRRRAEWLKEQGWEVLQATQLNMQLRDAIRLSSDDISDALVTAVQARIWEKGIGHFSDNPDRCKVNHAQTMLEWVEADWGLGMTMPQLYRTVANKRMNSSAVEAATLLVEATPLEVLETVAYTAKSGDLLSQDIPGWMDISAANEKAYGPEWGKVRDAIDDRLHREQGSNKDSATGKFTEPVGNRDGSSEVSSKSREGRRRTLKRYSDDPKLCADKGVEQSAVQQALRAFEEGELSATGALRACGLLAPSDASTNRVFLVRDSQEVARRLIAAAGHDRAAEIAAALNHLLTENA